MAGNLLRPLKNVPIRPISALHSDFNPQNIQHIPAVNPAKAGLTRLDLKRNRVFFRDLISGFGC